MKTTELAESRPDLPAVLHVAADVRKRFPHSTSATRPVVTTGQQVGLFTGPLLTLVKAEAVLGLSRDLEAVGVPCDPFFWCASEDHDLVEVTRVLVPGPDGPRDLGPEAPPLAANRSPVGALVPATDLPRLVEELLAGSQPPFAEDARMLAALASGRTFLEGFVAGLSWLVGDPALRFLDAAALADKPALVPLARRVVRERAEVRRILEARAQELVAQGAPLQVKTEPTGLPLFALVGASRHLLREVDGRFTLKGLDGGPWTEADVVGRFESGEWLPSFSALTRPLAVSTLHPVAATVLGPAELAYWRQMLPLFEWAGLVRPVLVSRPSVVLVDRTARKLLERTGLSPKDLLQGPDAVRRQRATRTQEELLGRVDAVASTAREALEALRHDLVALDPSLGKGVDATAANVGFAVGKLKERAVSAAARADEAFGHDLDRLAAILLPGGKLAERVYSPLVILPAHGREALAGSLRRQFRWDDPGPQVIEI
jgi:bacillithiol biosynthesis cysteine-adding enzyme BshC